MNERIYQHGPDKLRSPDRTNRLEVDKIIQLCLLGNRVKSLLDIGTGSGLFAEAFARLGVSVSGVDINSNMIDAARRYLPNSEFFVAPAESLPFADGSFDVTFFGVVLHEVADYAKALCEAHRVTRICTYVLEWRHIPEEFGPPLEHRLTEKFIRDLSLSSGYRNVSADPVSGLVLYKLSK